VVGFSSRLPFSSSDNLLSSRLAARRAAGQPILDLTESNPTRAGLSPGDDELRDVLAPAGIASYAPDPRGLRTAREALAAHEGLDADDLLLTASTSESYALLFKLLCDPGDTVLAPRPSYPLFDHLAALEGVRLAGYDLVAADDWRLDLDGIARDLASDPRVRAILVVSPHNPTGAVLEDDELAALCALATRHGVAVVVDEVFAAYPANDAPAPGRVTCAARAAAAHEALVFSLGGLSKSCALPQLKLGWIAAGGPAPLRRAALARLELVADAYLSLATPVQLALPVLLEIGARARARVLARVRASRAAIAAALAPDDAISLAPARAGWSALLRFPATRSDEALALAALDRGVLTQPGYFFDLDGAWLVLSLLSAPADLARGIAELRLV
jgi:aspartate/methionine/tyrosine aminotransferase